MNNRLNKILIAAIPVLLIIGSCKKESTDIDYGVNEYQKDMINKAMVVGSGGKLYEGPMPTATGGTIAITDKPNAVQVSAGVLLYFNYNTSNNANLCTFYVQIDSADSYWAAPIEFDTIAQRPYVRILIPNFVRNGDYKLKFAVGDCAGNVSTIANTDVSVTDPLGCGASFSGNVGITALVANLGSKAGTATISYDMYSIPDRLDIRYDGQWIASTGTLLSPSGYPNCAISPDGFVSGSHSVTFNYDPGKSRLVEIYVSGCNSGTAWQIEVVCP
ncbi:MAG TPA: hypothetical protein PLU85_05695 [Bacteroidia bacterium]|nr:hypothetical protein [Bacteroidia bacterium]QQR94623.1 MAG: hypothetical protein IPJ93_12565 [Bacteroidota bacterium]MBP7714194.1 hypothetical protein [Bacteroidia bacterium]MBP8668154.1 hypothetical protein [Bacteroidia bacterium]HOZ82506.1 hypothetical protein [Bacteroidia bacterium]